MAGPQEMAEDRYEERPWGERLRTWRKDVKHWSRAEFRDEVEAAAYRLGENRGQKLAERLIGRWETGDVLRPQGVYCRILAHLGAPHSLPHRAAHCIPYHGSRGSLGPCAPTSTCYAQNWETT